MKLFSCLMLLATGLTAGAMNIVRGDGHEYMSRNLPELSERISVVSQRSESAVDAARIRANAAGRPIENAEGREVLYDKESVGTYGFYEEAFFYEGNFASKVIWDEASGKVYFYNILSLANYPSYIEGTLSGNEIEVSLPQSVFYNEEYRYGINLVAMKIHDYKDAWGRDAVEYLPDSSISSFKYLVEDDGTLRLQIPGEQYNGDDMPDYVIGLVYSDNNEWLGYSDFMQVMVPFEGKITAVPDNVEMREYTFIYDNYGIMVEVGYDKDTLYIRGLNPNFPDGTISAAIVGNKAYIKQNEVMGIYDNCFMFTKCVYENPDYDIFDDYSPEYIFAPEDAQYVLIISDDGDTITSEDDSMYLCLNGAKDRLYYLGAYRNFKLHYQSSFAGTPLPPYEPYWYQEFATGGVGSFYFYIPDQGKEDILLKTSCLYYRIYVDRELMTFQQEVNETGRPFRYYYYGFEEPTTLIPYDFMNWQDVYVYADTPRRRVDIYDPKVESLGVQTVYIYEGVTTVSDILIYDLTSGRITLEPADSAGVDTIVEESKASGVYNLQGVKVLDECDRDKISSLPSGFYIINGRKVAL